MPGFGTVLNVCGIVAGGVLGSLFGDRLGKNYRETLMLANAISVLFVGIAGAMSYMLKVSGGELSTQGTLMLVVSMAAGGLLGELADLDGRSEKLGIWLRHKTGNDADSEFVEGFVSASLVVCVGAMAVVGSIEDGLTGDYSILAAKAVMDMVVIFVMTASLGRGCIFSAIPVGVIQGTITLLAVLAKPLFTDAAMANLSLTGSVLIFCVGVNLIWGKKFRVANMLPALVFAVAWAFLF